MEIINPDMLVDLEVMSPCPVTWHRPCECLGVCMSVAPPCVSIPCTEPQCMR